MLIALFLSILLLIACIYDWFFRKIPNLVVIAIGLIGVANMAFNHFVFQDFAYWLLYLAAGMVFFYFGLFGAGDVKLMLVLLLCISAEYWLLFVLLLFMLGGVWVLIYAFLLSKVQSQKHFNGLPYAFPITFSAVIFIAINTYPF